MNTVLEIVILIGAVSTCSVFQYASGQAFCGNIGAESAPLHGPIQDERFYLNVGDTACRGSISSFTYCFYKPNEYDDQESPSYFSTFAIYRENTQTSRYEVMSPVFVAERSTSDLVSLLGVSGNDFTVSFRCDVYTPNVPVTVEAGDVLGACVFDPSGDDNEQLDIVGNRFTSLGMLMKTGSNGCGINTVPSSVTSASLQDSSSLALHLYANIVPLPETQPPPITTMATTIESTSAPVTTAPTIMATTVATTMETAPVTTEADTITSPDLEVTTVSTDMFDSTTATIINAPVTTDTDGTSEPTSILDTTTEDQSLSTLGQSSDAGRGPVGDSAGIIVPIVVVVLTVLAVSVAITIVIIMLWTRKRRLTKKSYPVAGVDNMVYGITEDSSPGNKPPAVGSEHYEEITQSRHQSQQNNEVGSEHTYEYDFTDSGRMNENTYAEVGPFDEQNTKEANDYLSPLDAPVISFAALLEKNKDEDIYGGENPYQVPATREDEIYSQLKSWGVNSVDVKAVEVVSHLGSGQFGSVEQGLWKRRGTKPVDVALKSLNNEGSEDKVKFLQEAAIMAQFRHPNVIMLYGVVSRGDPMMLVVEVAMKGDLRTFLLSLRPDPGELVPGNTSNMLLSFSQQVALGMQYLSAKGFVHRDLAARNVLVSGNNTCKVADFGMSRDLADENYYISQGRDKIPVKWTAPEAIHYKKYSTASDVWAYGCLLYEIWSVGHKPFEGVTNINALRLVDSGERLSPPPGCPRIIYELMILCWHPETSLRPGFRDVVLTLVGSEQMVLSIPEEDSSSNPLAGVLGAPLEAGENMYTDLQKRYIDYQHRTERDTAD